MLGRVIGHVFSRIRVSGFVLTNPEVKKSSGFVLTNPEVKESSGFVLTNPEVKKSSGFVLTNPELLKYGNALAIRFSTAPRDFQLAYQANLP